MPHNDPEDLESQVVYLKYLIDKATESAQKIQPLAFDPQGRILIDVKLTEEDFARILDLSSIDLDLLEIDPSITAKETLEFVLKRKLTDTTTISLDIQDIPDLKAKFDAILRANLDQVALAKPAKDLTQTTKILSALETTSTGSIIPLQQEFHFQISLTARTYQRVLGKTAFPDKKMQEVHEDTLQKINQLVMKLYAEALDAAYVNGKINLQILTSKLDDARGTISSISHNILRHEMEKRGVSLSPEHQATLTHLAEKITATPNDVMHNSKELGLVTLIEGSEYTSHYRRTKEKFAHREILTQVYGRTQRGDCTISEKINHRIQIRTPSLDLKSTKFNQNESAEIEDIAYKLGHLVQHYQLSDRLPEKSERIPKAFIYNLQTAFNGWTSQEGKNKQTQGAQRILKASHVANAQQMEAADPEEGPDPVFCFVQNISVNGFGDSLGPINPITRGIRWIFGYNNGVKDEATLMADMALMHTLYDTASETQKNKIEAIMKEYIAFLKDPQRPDYFVRSEQGTQAAQLINELKEDWKNEPSVARDQNAIVDNAKAALKNLIANNLHYDNKYGKLVQTLSIFVEAASAAGCKSGNERTQAINERVTILDALANNPEFLSKNSDLAERLKDLAAGNNVVANTSLFKNPFDRLYNDKGLQTALSLISLIDQAAAGKLEAKRGFAQLYNTNFGEESADVMTNLHQNKASIMQSHVGLDQRMAKTWEISRSNNEQVVAESVQPIQEKPNSQQIKEQLIRQIGDYGASDFQVSSILSAKGVKILHSKVEAYKNSSEYNEDNPQQHREKFIKYLFSPAMQEKMGFSAHERQAFLAQGKPKDGAIKMEQLLDETGVRLYKAALKEERCSEEFMQATLKASTEHHDGEKWAKRMVVILGGPSASGKTFGATSVVAKAAEFMPKIKEDVMAGNDIVSIDGAVPREISQMRKLMIQYAINLGYTGISNLQKKSEEALHTVKNDIAKAVVQTPGLSMVMPETFANPGKISSFISKLKALKDMNLIFASVDSKDTSFKPTVAFNGEKRAWKIDNDPLPGTGYDLNMAKKYIPESKSYQGKHFDSGRKGTKLAKRAFESEFPGLLKMKVVYDLILVKRVGANDWEQTNEAGAGVQSFSKRIFDAWKKLPPEHRESLEAFNKKELPNLGGAVIKTPEQLTLESTALKLEKRMQEAGETRVQPIIDQIRELHALFKLSNWEKYQNSIDNIRLNIKIALEYNRPLPLHAIAKLEKLNEKLAAARENVPEGFKKPMLKVEMPTNRTLVPKSTILEFERVLIPNGTPTPELVKNLDKPITRNDLQLQTQKNMVTECEGAVLKKGDHIRSYKQFAENRFGVLLQNDKGRIDYFSSENLEFAEKVHMAIEQAQMLLVNWKPNCGPIIIKGRDSGGANCLYAAMLLLKDSHPSLKNIAIESWVAKCSGPTRFEFESTYINRYLGNEKEGPLPTKLRNALKQETAELIRMKSTEFLKDKLKQAKDDENEAQQPTQTF